MENINHLLVVFTEKKGDADAAARDLVERTADLVYARVPATEFLEVVYASGGRETLHLGDFSSGAMLESIVARAKRLAIKRELDDGGDGLAISDLEAAVAEELRENEDLPSTSNPDDWARIAGRRGEPIVQLRTLGPDAAMRRRPVEARTPGQYL